MSLPVWDNLRFSIYTIFNQLNTKESTMNNYELKELMITGYIDNPANEQINIKFSELCDKLESQGKTQFEAIAIATVKILNK